jgi:hypothetical protein
VTRTKAKSEFGVATDKTFTVGNEKQKFMEGVNDFISPTGYVKYITQAFQKFLRTISFYCTMKLALKVSKK